MYSGPGACDAPLRPETALPSVAIKGSNAVSMGEVTTPAITRPEPRTQPSRIRTSWVYAKHSPKLVVGLLLLGLLFAIWFIGPLVVDTSNAAPMSSRPDLAPNRDELLGTDTQGRS